MSKSMDYPYEKFYNAIHCLASGSGSIQNRLENAYLSFHTIQSSDFDRESMGIAYQKILSNLTLVKDENPEKGYVRATLERMNDEDASNIASSIMDLFIEISEIYFKE